MGQFEVQKRIPFGNDNKKSNRKNQTDPLPNRGEPPAEYRHGVESGIRSRAIPQVASSKKGVRHARAGPLLSDRLSGRDGG
jgi:hypothetical protein